MHRTRTCTTHTITHLRRQVHTHLHSHDGTTGTVRCAQVHRYSGEPTPSKLTCTHTQARAGPHRCVCVRTLTGPHRRTDTRKHTPSLREPHTQVCTRPHTHTGHPHGRASPALCTERTELPSAVKRSPWSLLLGCK